MSKVTLDLSAFVNLYTTDIVVIDLIGLPYSRQYQHHHNPDGAVSNPYPKVHIFQQTIYAALFRSLSCFSPQSLFN